MKIVNADAVRNLLREAGKDPNTDITEQDLLALGFKPTRAWVLDGDLVVFEVDGSLHSTPVAYWPI